MSAGCRGEGTSGFSAGFGFFAARDERDKVSVCVLMVVDVGRWCSSCL